MVKFLKLNFLKTLFKVGPASKKLVDAEGAKAQLAKDEVVVYYLGADDTEMGKAFSKVLVLLLVFIDKMRD